MFYTDNTNAIKLIASTKVRVFPCAYRGFEGQTNIIDPEARAFTEKNFTNIYSKDGTNKNSFIVSWDNSELSTGVLKLIIGGYYFEIKDLSIAALTDASVDTFIIRTKDVALENGGGNTTTVLDNLSSSDNEYYLDQIQSDDVYYFSGIALVNSTHLSDYTYTAKLQVLDGAHINYSAKRITDILDTDSGLNSFRTIGNAESHATAAYSIALGNTANSSAENALAIGKNSTASAISAIALGDGVTSSNLKAVAIGSNLTTSKENQIVLGTYNKDAANASLILGNGIPGATKNIFTVGTDGSIINEGDITSTGNLIVKGGTITVANKADNILNLGSSTNNKSGAIHVFGNGADEVFTVTKTGATTIKDTLDVTNKATLKNSLEVNGTITAAGKADNTLTLGSATDGEYGAIDVYGTSTSKVFTVANDGATNIAKTLTVDDATTLNKALLVNDDTEIKGNLKIRDGIECSWLYKELATQPTSRAKYKGYYIKESTGYTLITDDNWEEKVTNTSIKAYERVPNSITGALNINDALTVAGVFTASSDANITGNLSATGTATGNRVIITVPDKYELLDDKGTTDTSDDIYELRALYIKKADNTEIASITTNGNFNTIGAITGTTITGTSYKLSDLTLTQAPASNNKICKDIDNTRDIINNGALTVNKGLAVNGKLTVKLNSANEGDFVIADSTKATTKITNGGSAYFAQKLCVGAYDNVDADISNSLLLSALPSSLTGNFYVDANRLITKGDTAIGGDVYIGASLSVSNAKLTAKEIQVNTNLAVTNNITATTYNATSDIRKKTNIKEFNYSKSILDLPIKTFEFINDEKHINHIGCIAQDLQQLYPELVHEEADGYLAIEENKLVYLLLEEVKKLKEEIKVLKEN